MRLTEPTARATTHLEVDPTLDAEINSSTDHVIVELKGSERLARIRTSLKARASITMKTSPVSRVMRRDWNIVSAKLFLNAIDHHQRNRIASDLTELHWQSTDLLEVLRAIPMPKAEAMWMRPRALELQVVHPLAAQWLRCMRTLDECYLIMINAEKSGSITRKQRWAMVAPTQMAYMGFKASAMNLPLKTSMELLEQAGL